MVRTLPLLAALLLQQPAPRTVHCPAEVRTYAPVVERAFRLELEAVRPRMWAVGTFAMPDGRIALARSGPSVHVFGPDGAWLHDLEAAPGVDYHAVRTLTVGPDGSWLRNRRLHSGTFDVLSPSGALLGTRELGSPRICFVGDHGERWVIGDEELALVGADGVPRFETGARPDGKPLYQTFGWCALPDGSLLVSETWFPPVPSCLGFANPPVPHPRTGDPHAAICHYGADGRPIATWILPDREVPTILLPLDRRLVLSSRGYNRGSFRVLDLETGTLTQPEPAAELAREPMLGLHLAPEGDALLWVQWRTGEVFRVSLP